VSEKSGEICILTNLLDRMPCGVGRYIEALLEEFATLPLAGRIRLVHGKQGDHPHYRRFGQRVVPMPRGPGRETRWAQRRLPRVLRRMRPALVHCPIQTNPPVFGMGGVPLVLTVWDFSPVFWKDPGWSPARRRLVFGLILGRAIERAAAIIVPSESTRADLERLFGRRVEKGGADRIAVIPCAADKRLRRREDLPRPLESDYLLYVGSAAPRKDVATLIQALGALRRKGRTVRLVLVMKREEFAGSGLSAAAETERVADLVEIRERVEIDDLAALYTHCGAFVFPSLYEGFGLPVLEAMACGAPVVTTRRSSLPEVAGEAALFFREGDPGDLAQAIERLLADGGLRKRLSREGLGRAALFSWRRTAEQTAEVYEMVLGKEPREKKPL